jgi:hypothetical protein
MFYSSTLWAGRVGIACMIDSARMLHTELVEINTYQIFNIHYITYVI